MPGTCWGNFSANISDIFIFKHQVIADIRHFYFQPSDFFKHLTLYFQTLYIFKDLAFFFKHQIFQNIWHFYFQTLDIFKQLTLYFQTSDMLKHLTFVFSNLRYFQKSDIFIFNTRSSNFFVVSLALQSGEGRFCWQLKPC